MTPFVSCPVDVLRAQVSPTAYKVFLVLKSFDNKEHKIFPSKKTLAERCSLGPTSIYNAIKQLVKAGLVKVVSRFDRNGRRPQISMSLPPRPANSPSGFLLI